MMGSVFSSGKRRKIKQPSLYRVCGRFFHLSSPFSKQNSNEKLEKIFFFQVKFLAKVPAGPLTSVTHKVDRTSSRQALASPAFLYSNASLLSRVF